MNGLPEQVRSFIAIAVPASVRADLVSLQRELKPTFRYVSWTRPEAMHLTLQFLGNIESACLPGLEIFLCAATHNLASFELALGRIGSFGNRVIWVGLERGAEPLHQLANAVASATRPFIARTEERACNPHVTLGRSRRPARGLAMVLRRFSMPQIPAWAVNHFELIRSELSPHGSRYTTLASFPLHEP